MTCKKRSGISRLFFFTGKKKQAGDGKQQEFTHGRRFFA
jgi:hypothetical protein